MNWTFYERIQTDFSTWFFFFFMQGGFALFFKVHRMPQSKRFCWTAPENILKIDVLFSEFKECGRKKKEWDTQFFKKN